MPRYRRTLKIERAYKRQNAIPGEFIEPPPAIIRVLRRGIGLASDLSLLLLFSPFFAIWFLYRGALRLRRAVLSPKT
jgi:hypothetical protein